jgi:hypothetical protein
VVSRSSTSQAKRASVPRSCLPRTRLVPMSAMDPYSLVGSRERCAQLRPALLSMDQRQTVGSVLATALPNVVASGRHVPRHALPWPWPLEKVQPLRQANNARIGKIPVYWFVWTR